MTKKVLYQYLGTNGSILSPVHLEDVYYVRYIQLTADKNKYLVNGSRRVDTITVPEEEVEDWSEE